MLENEHFNRVALRLLYTADYIASRMQICMREVSPSESYDFTS
jgi:hypothetical protein